MLSCGRVERVGADVQCGAHERHAACMQVLPELRSILESASGAQLLVVLASVADLQAAMRVDQVEEVLMPVLLKALAGGDSRVQEEVRAQQPPLHTCECRRRCVVNVASCVGTVPS
jgi:hypothetical protein